MYFKIILLIFALESYLSFAHPISSTLDEEVAKYTEMCQIRYDNLTEIISSLEHEILHVKLHLEKKIRTSFTDFTKIQSKIDLLEQQYKHKAYKAKKSIDSCLKNADICIENVKLFERLYNCRNDGLKSLKEPEWSLGELGHMRHMLKSVVRDSLMMARGNVTLFDTIAGGFIKSSDWICSDLVKEIREEDLDIRILSDECFEESLNLVENEMEEIGLTFRQCADKILI